MKILEVGMTAHIGGMETYFHNYYYYFSPDFHFDFIGLEDGLCFADEYEAKGSKVFYVPSFKRKPMKYFIMLRKIIKEGKYDLVHANMLSTANILPILAARSAGTRVVAHSHNNDTPKGLIRKIMHGINKPIVKNLSNGHFACSNLAGKWMFDDDMFDVIPNAMDISTFAFNDIIRNEIRKEYNLGNAFVIGHVGRFQEQKNHKYIVKIFKDYHKLNPNSKLLLVGKGELFESIREELVAGNVVNDVLFVKETYEVEKFYQAMDIFIFPSLFEGFGMAAIEAQFSGLPCLSSEYVCRDTELTENVRFLGVEDKDISKWIEEIEYFRKLSPGRIITLKNNNFDINEAVKHFEKCFESVLK